MAELLRPPPRSSWRDRLAAVAAGVTVTRLLTTPAPCCWSRSPRGGCCASPAPPVERSLPSARSAGRRAWRHRPAAARHRTTVTAGRRRPPRRSATDVVVQAAGAVAAPGVYRVAPVPVWSTSSPPPAGPPPTPTSRPWRWRPRSPTGRGSTCRGSARRSPPRRLGHGHRRRRRGVGADGPPATPANPLDLNQATRARARGAPGRGAGHGARPSSPTAPSTARSPPSTTSLDVRGIGPAKLDAFRDARAGGLMRARR